jgi:hypothetical protein
MVSKWKIEAVANNSTSKSFTDEGLEIQLFISCMRLALAALASINFSAILVGLNSFIFIINCIYVINLRIIMLSSNPSVAFQFIS